MGHLLIFCSFCNKFVEPIATLVGTSYDLNCPNIHERRYVLAIAKYNRADDGTLIHQLSVFCPQCTRYSDVSPVLSEISLTSGTRAEISHCGQSLLYLSST